MIFLKPRFLLLLSLSFVLAIIPLPEFLGDLRPSWAFILVLYLQFFMPQYFNVAAVFLIGLCLDVLLVTTLGEHAFSMLLTTWLAASKARRFSFFSPTQQIILVGFFCYVYQFLLIILDAFQGYHYEFWPGLCRAAMTMLLWPWFKSLADKILLPKLFVHP
ncbi:rod shape-determining protein MreD [Legionella londiniensis]|uniref:Rod shape-determining protein MreD n=1 Tax=Legionella londiniensis TaxID=45068 RepID=A0A0W0VRK4_9GAMM|nr:rod shape-determining protein MreD [Legionella londiniensis]KTD22377.1 rod shape-determining protein MreD [Legionella londiniensis]STX93049.1 rod shape determining protein MreD [Legionella londiniensis]